jgi:hypothetical protein
MAISFKKYVNITSGVGGGAAVARRDLIGRLFTTNELVPPQTIIEMTELSDVGTYFGTTSEEYKRASFYFGFISKNITRPKKISYTRWVDVATEPKIFGNTDTKAVGSFSSLTDGSFDLTIGGVTHTITTNLTTAVTLANVATLITAQIAAESEPQFSSGVMTFDTVRNSFKFVGGVAEAATISAEVSGSGTDILTLLGFNNGIFSNGSLVETLTDNLTSTTEISNNFGSFLFLPTLTLTQVTEVGNWNKAQNVMFQYYVAINEVDATTYYTALKDIAGIGLTVAQANEYHEMMPMVVLAATNYTKINSTQNYMFQMFSATPTVTTTPASNTLDAVRANYYGSTQQAGQNIEFYQRGVLMGLSTDPVSMNTYANEQWFKDSAGASIMSLLLSLAKVSANIKGRSQIISTVQSVINEALFNGTISIGKDLNNTQKIFISEITGDDDAWMQVQNIGYWLDATIESYVAPSSLTEYKAVYTLIYSKDDAIRSVDGTHILI